MALSERIRILLVKRGNISEAELARRIGVSPQNLNNKMKRDNFTERDLQEIAAALLFFFCRFYKKWDSFVSYNMIL